MMKLYIFSFLDASDLCNVCLVNRSWRKIATDESLWKKLLLRDSLKWSKISYDKMPDVYRRVCPNFSTMQV